MEEENHYDDKIINKAVFNEYAENYEESLFQHDYFVIKKCDIIRDVIKNNFETKPILADFGCGPGEIISLLGPITSYNYGIDISNKMIDLAEKKNISNSKFLCRNSDYTGIKSDSIDIAISLCMFHHIDDDNTKILALQEMKRIVKPNGIIMIFEHNPWNPLTRLVVNKTPLDKGVKLISTRQMKKLLKSVYIMQVKISHICFLPKQLRRISKIEKYFRRIPLGGQYFVLIRNE